MQIQKFALALLLSACGGEFQHSGLLAPFSNKARSEDASQFDPSLSLSLSQYNVQPSPSSLFIVSRFLIPSRHLAQ